MSLVSTTLLPGLTTQQLNPEATVCKIPTNNYVRICLCAANRFNLVMSKSPMCKHVIYMLAFECMNIARGYAATLANIPPSFVFSVCCLSGKR